MTASTDERSPYLHERLRAYQVALEFYAMVKAIRRDLPRGLGPIADQLTRAAQSVCLNLAEGAASRFPDVKRRHWNIAVGSAAECAAALDILAIEGAVQESRLAQARERLRLSTLLTLGLAK